MPKVAMTERFVSTVKPEKRTEYFDTHTRGLSLIVGEGGHRAWWFHYRRPADDKRARLKLGIYPQTGLARARTLALESGSQLEAGHDPRDVRAAEAQGALTVAGLIESYLAKHVRPHLRSAAAVERRFNKNVVPEIGSVRVADLHAREVNRVLDALIGRDAQIEAGRVFEDMRAAFRWAVARGDLDHSPMEGMKKPGASKPRERVLTDDEIYTLWNGLPESLARSKTCQRIIKLCLVTAQRVGEVAGMRCDELDLRQRTWSLPGSRTKNGHAHIVPLSDLAVSIINEALEDAGEGAVFVFPMGDDAMSPHAVARTIGRAQETSEERPHGRFGIPRWTAHDLRRTALTNFARLGVAPIVAGATANHLSVTKATVTLSVYVQYSYDREKREALDMWAERLAGIVEGKGATVLAMRGAS